MRPIPLLLFGAAILFMIISTQGETILCLGLPLYSHLKPMTVLARELHKRGHESYFSVPEKLTKNLKLSEGSHFLPMIDDPNIEEFNRMAIKMFSPQKIGKWKDIQKILWDICDNLLLDEDWFQKLKSVNATLAIVDGIFMSRCLTLIPYRLSIPFVYIGAENAPMIHRTPWSFSAFPNKISTFSEKMSFFERMQNSMLLISSYVFTLMGTPSKSIKTYVPNRPDISFDSLARQAQLHIVDGDFLLDYALPALPNVEYLGGLGTEPAKSIEGDLFKFVDSSKHGIVVVSFGSVVSSLPKDHLDKMGEAFKQLKYDVVWKQKDDSYSSDNVLLTKWMPQNDLLGHPKTRLFITHCGNGGQFESLYHAVPMLGFPVFADQPHNAKRMQLKGYGISMNLYNYTVADLVKNINEIIENPKYKNKIQIASNIFRSRPEHPSVRGARIVDDIIKYGGGFMRSYCQDMPLYQYFMLDILAVVLSVVVFGILIIFLILRKCLSFCCRKKEKAE